MAKPRTKKNSNGNVNGAEVAASNPALEAAIAETSVETASLTLSEPAETKTVVRKSARKPEIVKSDLRSNLFPINLEDEIRQLAYLISERRGFEPGHETEDWLNAEHEVVERYQHHHTVSA